MTVVVFPLPTEQNSFTTKKQPDIAIVFDSNCLPAYRFANSPKRATFPIQTPQPNSNLFP
jgi:hypothetical protein